MPRERLYNRRASETFDMEAFGIRWNITFSRYDDGRLAEVFLSGPKAGAHMEAVARDAAIILSLALQHGCPVDRIRHAMTREQSGEAAGLVGHVLDHLTAMAA